MRTTPGLAVLCLTGLSLARASRPVTNISKQENPVSSKSTTVAPDGPPLTSEERTNLVDPLGANPSILVQ